MKKQLFLGLILVASMMLPLSLSAQTTQGTDFWVTLMRGDGGGYTQLSLTFAAKKATKVYLENVRTGFKDTVEVGNDTIKRYILNDIESLCYVTEDDEEQAVDRALRVQSDEPISLIAANYKDKSFDVAAILPTAALMSEYRVQCYTPSAHVEGSGSNKHRKPQGSHFAIVAADDNVIVDITPSVATHGGKAAGVTFATDTLKKGQVYYVWSGADDCDGSDGDCQGEGEDYDFTGTIVKARNNKKIAVFNGNSHTNIPFRTRDRDHIYSQAMPVNYWGKRFAITSSLTTIDDAPGYWERIDKIRVQALVDGTVVKVDGVPVHTFDFVNGSNDDQKHFFEFDFGAKDSKTGYDGDGHQYFSGTSHYIETSCPSAVHLFMTSNQYDHQKISGVNTKYCNGDPSEIWVNPIEQKIDTLTFGVFKTEQVQDHFLNIVTSADNVSSVRLDNEDISSQFSPLNGNPNYMFARITNLKDSAHTLTADSGFIAHVYGFGEKESYGYPAGGRTNDLTSFVIINGNIYREDSENKICGDDKVTFGCELNYEYDSIYWYFGDGKDTLITEKTEGVAHFYEKAQVYNAYVLFYRHVGDEDNCINFSNHDSIAFIVNIGNYKVDILDVELPYCSKEGDVVDMTVHLSNPALVILDPTKNDSVKITFDAVTKAAGFKESEIRVQGDTILVIRVPATAKNNTEYGLHLHIGSECPNSVLDKDLAFTLIFDIPVLAQRYNNILGVLRDSFPTQELVDFVWIHNGDTIPDQHTSVLYLDENDPKNNGEYHVCFTIKEEGKADRPYCTCPVTFKASTEAHSFEADATGLNISAYYTILSGGVVFVNADYKGETDIECYAQWIDAKGNLFDNLQFNIPDGGCTIPAPKQAGLYLLRVVTGKGTRSFKFVIQ